jgi:glucose dehydrogenase
MLTNKRRRRTTDVMGHIPTSIGSTARMRRASVFAAALLTPVVLSASVLTATARAQERGNPYGEWRYWGADAWSTRYSPVDQINADNFENLEVAWTWRGDNFGPEVDYIFRSTPIYANGKLYTVAGRSRQVVAIDPATGETLWTYREPHTTRWERSWRQSYGKGVAYAEVDGRGVIYTVSPAFFLHALDAETGLPLEGFGGPVPLRGFGDHGTVDLLGDLGHPYDPDVGIEPDLGSITSSSPPIVVNGVVIVGNSNLTGRFETRQENIPGDILAYDARTGKHLWTFHVVPRPGEFGHETWENDAWSFAGNANAWAPMSADPERGIVYVPTDAPTNDYFGGFRPGANLFGNSLLALDVRTGRRLWHFQMVHHDVWDWDNPTAPSVVDVTVNGVRIPAIVQTTKQANEYAFNRVTGEPIWPIEERPVPAGNVPTEWYSPTQPFPTKPAPVEPQALTEDQLIDFTPELHRMALDLVKDYKLGPMFNPPVQVGNEGGYKAAVMCPSPDGGTNIPGGTVTDPETGIIYVASVKSCAGRLLIPGAEADATVSPPAGIMSGKTVVAWHYGGGGGFGRGPQGLPLLKPPYGRITAIDMNTGEHLWWIPNGDTPENVKNHPLLQGLDLPNTGEDSHATALVTRTLLIYAEGRGGEARMHAVDKRTGERLGTVALPAPSSTAPMTFMHEGKQYIVVPIAGGDSDPIPGSLVALRLR